MRDDDLVVLASYASGVEAGFAQQLLEEAGIAARLGSDATATWLSHYGTALGGVKLLVRRADMADAVAVLQDRDPTTDGFEWPEVHDDEEDDEETASDSEPHPALVRAFRAAVVGCCLAPLGVSLYSLYLIVRHRLFLPDRGGNDWRFYVAMLANTFGFYIAKWFWMPYW
jgi:hypothetical protein